MKCYPLVFRHANNDGGQPREKLAVSGYLAWWMMGLLYPIPSHGRYGFVPVVEITADDQGYGIVTYHTLESCSIKLYHCSIIAVSL